MNSLQHALKEWAVAVRALERGETALVVRKGGIREKAFAVSQTRFLLLPGYEHQRPELLKEEYRGLMDRIPDLADDGPLRFSSFAEVEGAYEISEAEELTALDAHHMWTPEYAESRFKWRPKKPLTVLVLRTYLLPEEVELPYRDEYGGCKSWIGLQESRRIAALQKADRYPGLRCPNCQAPPPVGTFQRCLCGAYLDVFRTGGQCFRCGTQHTAAYCVECGTVSPLHLWADPSMPMNVPPRVAGFEPIIDAPNSSPYMPPAPPPMPPHMGPRSPFDR